MRDSRITPLATKSNGETGYYIAQKDYEDILDAIRNMGASMETNRAAEHQDEEGLRGILLAGLSSSIKRGSAGGELFRKSGKTDISIIFDNKAAFVAECKLWKGKQYINEGISQLLKYTTWRDVKVSLVIFNKTIQGFSKLQEQISNIFRTRADNSWICARSPQTSCQCSPKSSIEQRADLYRSILKWNWNVE